MGAALKALQGGVQRGQQRRANRRAVPGPSPASVEWDGARPAHARRVRTGHAQGDRRAPASVHPHAPRLACTAGALEGMRSRGRPGPRGTSGRSCQTGRRRSRPPYSMLYGSSRSTRPLYKSRNRNIQFTPSHEPHHYTTQQPCRMQYTQRAHCGIDPSEDRGCLRRVYRQIIIFQPRVAWCPGGGISGCHRKVRSYIDALPETHFSISAHEQ
jgi:hypothetical protein